MEKNDHSNQSLLAGAIMDNPSGWETINEACDVLMEFEVASDEQVVSAHQIPKLLSCYSQEEKKKGLKVIIAGAEDAVHLPEMVAS